MASFVKSASYTSLVRKTGIRRMKKVCRARFKEDLEGYLLTLDMLARRFAHVQGRRIVKKEHIELALRAMDSTQK